MKKMFTMAFVGLWLLVGCETESMNDSDPNAGSGTNTGGNPNSGGNTGGGNSGGGSSGGGSGSTADPTLYTGPFITFEKAAGADPNQLSNQDRITDDVWITRGSRMGLYNASSENGYTKNVSPAGTEWAEGSLDDYDTLTYSDWEAAVFGSPPSSVGKMYVVHLIDEDIYLQLEVLSWGQGASGNGSFSYRRSSPSE